MENNTDSSGGGQPLPWGLEPDFIVQESLVIYSSVSLSIKLWINTR